MKMDRIQCKQLALNITNEQLLKMLDRAQAEIVDWRETSRINPSLSKGAVWNVVAANFNLDSRYHTLAITNMLMEFGEFLPEELVPLSRATKKIEVEVMHQEPILNRNVDKCK